MLAAGQLTENRGSLDGLQIGGGINDKNAKSWIEAGASKVRSLVLPWLRKLDLFAGHRHFVPLPWRQILVGTLEEVIFYCREGETSRGCEASISQIWLTCVLLRIRHSSCRRRGDKWLVAMNKWQDITDMEVSEGAHAVSLEWNVSL